MQQQPQSIVELEFSSIETFKHFSGFSVPLPPTNRTVKKAWISLWTVTNIDYNKRFVSYDLGEEISHVLVSSRVGEIKENGIHFRNISLSNPWLLDGTMLGFVISVECEELVIGTKVNLFIKIKNRTEPNEIDYLIVQDACEMYNKANQGKASVRIPENMKNAVAIKRASMKRTK